MDSFLERMRWFYRNIELQVEDIKLEEADKTIVHYFDAGDVQGALLGIQDLYQEGPNGVQFNKSEFDSKRTLIRSLLSSKRLGQIRLLPPHQDELISKLKRGFKHWTRSQWKDKVAHFIAKVGLSPDLYPQHIEAQDSATLAALLKEDLEQAEKLFKVFQNLLPWHRRLGIWQRKELIYYENTKIDPSILLSREFKLLERKLSIQAERKDKFINNFTDALAWTYLLYLIKRFNSGSSHIVPRLYSPETKFSLQKILKLPIDNRELNDEEKAIEENFGCKSGVGRLSVLRDDDYYLFKVAFRPDSLSTSSSKPTKGKTDKDEKLVALYTQLSKLIPSDEAPEKKEELPLESFNKLSYEGTPILNIIKGLEQLTFFKSSWLKGELYKDLWDALSDIRQHLDEVEDMQEMQETLQQKKYQDAVKIILTDIQGKIEEKVQAFSSIPTFWKALSNGIKNLESRIHRDEWGVNDYYRDLGLLRYGFPPEIRSKVTQIIDGLCSGDEDRIQDQYLQFIQDYLNARFYAREDEDSLMTSTAILLALRMYRDVFDLLKDHQFKHFSLQIACAEMFLNLGKKDHHFDKEHSWRQGRKVIEELRQLEASSTTPEQKAELCVGLAYLFYHAWRFKDNDAQWRKVSLASGHQSNEWKRWQDLIDSATTYASRAYNLLEGTDRNQLKVYALNEYVFFLIEGGAPERMGEIKEAAELLAGCRAEPDVWQFRCDDTLARFHHRLAVYARTEAEWEEHTAEALSLIEEARKRSDIDQQIESYYRLLKIYKTRGFSDRRM